MAHEWDDYAQGWDDNPSVAEYAEKAYASLISEIDIKHLRVLDFGCGTGQLTQKISPLVSLIVALDPSQKMIEVLAAKQLPNVVTLPEALDLNLLGTSHLLQQKFDLVVASSALAFVPDYQQTLKLLASLLCDKGCLVQWDWLKAGGKQGPGFSQQQIEENYGKAGLKLTSFDSPFSIKSDEAEMPVLMAIGQK